MNDLKVSIIQSAPVWNDVKQSLFELDLLMEMLPDGQDIVFLPEVFNSGFTSDVSDVSEVNGGYTLDWMKEIAKNKNVALCGSFFVRTDAGYFNRCYFVTADGNVLYYDKRHLFRLSFEREILNAGNNKCVVNFKGWRINIQICYDLRFPLWNANTFDNGEFGYDLIVFVANWPSSRELQRQILLKARAVENQSYCIGVNRVGVGGDGIEYPGCSMVIAPEGKLLALAGDKTEVLSAVLSYDLLRNGRVSFPFASDW